MEENRQINIKNRTYYFYNDQINIEDSDASLLKVDITITKRLTFITLVMTFKEIANCSNINSEVTF